MEKKEEVTYNEDGTYVKKGEINTYPKDGFVPMSEMYPHDPDHAGSVGYGVKHHYVETNDQRIIIPCLLMFIAVIGTIVGLVMGETKGIVIAIISLLIGIISTIYLINYLKKRKNKVIKN